MKLPDQLLVRYFRAGEIESIRTVTLKGDQVSVLLDSAEGPRSDRWRDLGGGIGYVPNSK